MKIAVDATSLPPSIGGAGKYIINLIKGLANVDKENMYYIFAKKRDLSKFNINQRNFNFIACSTNIRPLRLLWEQFVLPFHLWRYKIDVLHSPHYTTPLMLGRWKSVVTFHDMTFYLYPERHILSKRLFFKIVIPLSLRRCDWAIANSNSTKEDMIRILNADPCKITVIHLAADPRYKPIGDLERLETIKRDLGISNKYILYVGTLEPRKNIPQLIKAYSELRKKGIRHRLVIAGGKGWNYDNIFNLIKSLNLEDKVIFTGYVSEKELPILYNGADVFIYPSLYEGFGIPPLEAMSCGVPTISSNASSLPEVVGEGGILVDPGNIEALRDVMYQVLTDNSLRIELCKKGLEQAGKFSWEKTAEETIKVYKKALHRI
ncbi:MAG: glycosyltransferase family 4 protein [bacterium]